MNRYNPDLELTLDALIKLAEERVRSGKKGLIVDDSRRIRFDHLLENARELKSYFQVSGAFSIGTCAQCEKFEQKYNNGWEKDKRPFGGLCGGQGGDWVHSWWTCRRIKRIT